MNPASIRADVSRRLAKMFPHWGAPTVEAPVLLSAGWESDIYQIDYAFAHAGSVSAPGPNTARNPRPNTPVHMPRADEMQAQGALVARLYFGKEVGHKAQTEFEILARLARAGYPCPTPLWVNRDEDGQISPWLRPALIMTRAPGEPMWDMVFRRDAATRTWAHTAFIEHLWALHSLDVVAAGLDEILPAPLAVNAVTAPVGRVLDIAQGLPSIGAEVALNWLAQQAPSIQPARLGLLHWDFHPANLLAEPFTGPADEQTRSVTVIDWSGAEIGDTRFDVAWTLIVVGSQEGETAAADILRDYEALAGPQADLDFFLAFACARRLYVMGIALTHGAETLGLRPGAEHAIRGRPAALRRIYEQWLALAGIALPFIEDLLQQLTEADPE